MDYGPGRIVHSLDHNYIGVVAHTDAQPPDDGNEYVALVHWWPGTKRQQTNWVTAEEITPYGTPESTPAPGWDEVERPGKRSAPGKPS
jgi:hypothetical protein